MSTRIPSLDGLRALAILLVLVSHFSNPSNVSHRLYSILEWYGNAGVRFFFVISGFLITTLLLREREKAGTINLKQFYVRRAYRILPAAYLYMIVITAIFYATFSLKDIVVAFTYTTAYAHYRPYVLTHLWSLSVEEQFYLLWPAIIAFNTVLARRVALYTIVITPMLRLVMFTAGFGESRLLPMSVDALAAGCWLAQLQPILMNYRSFFTWRGFGIIWALTLSIPLLGSTGHTRIYQSVCLPMFDIGIVFCIQNAILARHRVLNAAVPVWIGMVSYSLYLWHMPFSDPDVRSWYTTFPTNLALALLAAVVSYYAVERPVLRLRDRRSQPRSLQAGPYPESI